MKCPYCGSYNLYVMETRQEDEYTLRRKRCRDCGIKIFTEEAIPMKIQKDIQKRMWNTRIDQYSEKDSVNPKLNTAMI